MKKSLILSSRQNYNKISIFSAGFQKVSKISPPKKSSIRLAPEGVQDACADTKPFTDKPFYKKTPLTSKP